MYITIDNHVCHTTVNDKTGYKFLWRLHTNKPNKTTCVSNITFINCKAAIEAAKLFRVILNKPCDILYDTPEGKVKVV